MVSYIRRLHFLIHYVVAFLCIIAALVHCFSLSTGYFSFPVARFITLSVPLDLSLPKLSLCFSLDSLLSNQPEKFFFFENNSTFNQTIRYLMNKTTAIDQVISECAYRDWKTDSVVIKQPSDCMKYFSIRKYMTLGHSCYEFDPGTVKYSFFDAINSLERRRFLYRISFASPLNEGHKVYPLVHFTRQFAYELMYAQDILPSTQGDELYLISPSSFDLTSLPAPYESNCQVMSDMECFISCTAREFAKHGFVDYFGILGDDGSLKMPNFNSSIEMNFLSHFFNSTSPLCKRKCGSSEKCFMNFLVTSVHLSPGSVQKLSFEVQTLNAPVMSIKTIAQINLLDYLTQFASVCSFWLGFSVHQLLQRHQEKSRSFIRSSYFRLLRVESHLYLLLAGLSGKGHNLLFFIRRRVKVDKHKTVFFVIASLALKCAAVTGFAMQVHSVLSDYFKYDIEVSILVDLNPTVRAPVIHLCVPILDGDIASELFTSVTGKNYMQALEVYDRFVQRGKPVSKLINSSQPLSQILAGCRFRSNDSQPFQRLESHSLPECLRYFKIHRYYFNDRVCHGFTPENHLIETSQSTRRMITSDQGIFYSLILTAGALENRMLITLSDDFYPVVFRHYAATFRPTDRNSLYILSTSKCIAHLLPPPYRTMCHASQSRDECLEECFISRITNETDHLLYRGPIRESSIYEHATASIPRVSDWANATISKRLRSIEDACILTCRRLQCHLSLTKTITSHAYRSDSPTEFAVSLRSAPDQVASAVVKTTAFFVYYQVSCCANFWLGLVYISIGIFELRSTRAKAKAIASLNQRAQELKSLLSSLRKFIEGQNLIKRPVKEIIGRFSSIMSPTNTAIKSNLAKVITTGGCCIHLSLCLEGYFEYPTVTGYSYFLDSITKYELSVCNSLIEEQSSQLFERFETNNLTRRELDAEMDDILSRPIDPLILQPIGCSALGLRKQNNLSDHLKDLTDRLLFSGNHEHCESIFKSKFFLVNGLICQRFIQRKVITLNARMRLASINTFFSITIKRDDLTATFSVMVGDNDGQPLYGSLWSPVVFRPEKEARFIVSYIKYSQKLLPHPYDQGPTSAITVRCIYQCIWDKLSPLGLIHGFAEPNSTRRLVSKSEMKRHETQFILSRIYEGCKLLCASKNIDGESGDYFVTTIVQVEDKHLNLKPGTVEFVMMNTDYPVIIVTMKAEWQVYELLINLGSILNIWFGLCALSFDPRASDSSAVRLDCLHKCESQLSELLSLASSNAALTTGAAGGFPTRTWFSRVSIK